MRLPLQRNLSFDNHGSASQNVTQLNASVGQHLTDQKPTMARFRISLATENRDAMVARTSEDTLDSLAKPRRL